MALHAVENVEEAFGVTREFLTPINIRRWLKLALVVFFVGSGVSFLTAQFNTSTPPGDVSNGELPFSLPVDVMTLIVALVAAGILFGGLFALIGAIMEFVLIESLRTGEVTLRRHWRRRWRQGAPSVRVPDRNRASDDRAVRRLARTTHRSDPDRTRSHAPRHGVPRRDP